MTDCFQVKKLCGPLDNYIELSQMIKAIFQNVHYLCQHRYSCATFHKLMRHQNIAPISQAHFADDIYSSEAMEAELGAESKTVPEDTKTFCKSHCGRFAA